MKEHLQEKLSQQLPYSQSELDWMVEHIGDRSPAIRDELVYNSFCHAILEELLSTGDLLYLVQTILEQDLLHYQGSEKIPATLTRSFTALLLALILYADNNQDSCYFHTLSEENRQEIFVAALSYLTQEEDTTGWSDTYGWVHAIAHGAEFLMQVGLHDNFPSDKMQDIWDCLLFVLKKPKKIFTAGEERRLAILITQLLIAGKLDQNQLADWVGQLELPDLSPQEYFCRVNVENFLAAIFLQLEKAEQLDQPLKNAILTIWKGY